MSEVVCCHVGPEGAQGVQGLQGPAGPQGPQGIQGAQGLQGIHGLQGLTGAVGPQGPVGPSGLQGPAGVAGSDGAVGPPGSNGAAGPQGVAGPAGPTGPAGPEGAAGSVSVIVVEFGKLVPSAVSASSQTGAWSPAGVLTPGTTTMWLSGTDTGNQEYIRFDMGAPVLLTGLFCTFANGRDGLNTRIQASVDGAVWEPVAPFVPANYEPVTPENFRNYHLKLNLSKTYRHVQILSDAMPYMDYAFVQFFGTQ